MLVTTATTATTATIATTATTATMPRHESCEEKIKSQYEKYFQYQIFIFSVYSF